MLTIGLTGDVGAGKSTLCRVWKRMGATVYDADTVARSMWNLPEVRKTAEKRWGKGFFKGKSSVVFSKIANKIFNDNEEYEFVSKLLHKRTMEELERLIKSSEGLVIVEIPLLYECGVSNWFDGVVYAAASIEKRVERNVTRNWSSEEILRRESKLISREEKISRSDWVLENTGTLKEWRIKARKLGKIFLAKT